MPSANDVCYNFSLLYPIDLSLHALGMDPDRSAPYADMEQLYLGPHCLLQKLLEYISR